MKEPFLKTYGFLLVALFLTHPLFSQTTCSHGDHHHTAPGKAMVFVENQNQWHPNVHYQAALGGLDKVFLEKDAFTYLFHDGQQANVFQELVHLSDPKAAKQTITAHAYKARFLNTNSVSPGGRSKLIPYHNYFLGDDPERWAAKVPLFHKVQYDELYDGIQLLAYSQKGLFKYDFVLAPGADPQNIQVAYEGTNGLAIKEEQLHIQTAVGIIKEYQPYAYQMVDGVEKEVPCVYQLNQNILSFHFPNGYDNTLPLVIDPTVVASTLSGTFGTVNYGHTATFDNAGNIYAGGRSFGANYPTTIGSFQTNFAGGNTDTAITKYDPDGITQIFATYIGGNGIDYPHSMIVDINGQLCVYGSSNSTNYPTTNNSVQPTSGGLTDIVITKFSLDGDALIGSTYLGGDQNDGLNNSGLNDNYGDDFRGEIILDAQSNIFIVSSSSSFNFPVTPNVFQPQNNSAAFPGIPQDAVIAKFNSDLSTLYWASYLGSEDPDIGFAMRVDDFGNVYVTGVAGSADFPMAGNGVQNIWPGGEEKAFVAKISPNGQELLASTFFGSADGDEHSFFIDIDEEDQVHIYGQTTGTIDITPNTYFFTAGSKQFLAAFSNDLSTIVYSTVIGLGPGSSTFFNPNFVPVAFMVDKCNGIYLSGYDADANLPVTSDALYPVGSSDFYLAKLTPYAAELEFATYYPNAYHVDGGTSRFDKGGIVYQAVCSGSASTLSTLGNAWSTGQNSSWDIGVFKIDFEIETVTASALAEPSTSGCAPFTVDFLYAGHDAETYYWDFGNGATSTEMNPSQTFTEAGTYTIMQVVNAPATCNQTDTFYLQIDVLDNSSSVLDTTFCAGSENLFLDASTANATYLWQDGSTGATYQVTANGVFWVDVTISAGCSRRDSFIVNSATLNNLDLGDDLFFCDTASLIDIIVNEPWATAYEWSTGDTDSSIMVSNSGNYSVTVLDDMGCEATDTVNVSFAETPEIDLGPNETICEGLIYLLDATTPNATYEWQDGSTTPTYDATVDGIYSVTVTVGGCSDEDEVVLAFEPPLPIDLGEDQSFCDISSVNLSAINVWAVAYQWNTGSTNPVITVTNTGLYSVILTDSLGCETSDDIFLTLSQSPSVDIGPDTILCEGTDFTIDATTPNATYEWEDGSTGSTYPVNAAGNYSVIVTVDGCPAEDMLTVVYQTPLAVDLGEDQSFCDVASFELNAANPWAASYEWNTGATDPNVTVNSSGNYAVIITDSIGCQSMDNIMLTFVNTPSLDIGPDTTLCDGLTYIVDATTPNATYEWQDGSTAATFPVSSEGLYSVIVTVEGCPIEDEVLVAYEAPLPLELIDDQSVCDEPVITLDATTTGAVVYNWSTGDTGPIINVNATGNYSVTISDGGGCESVDDVNLLFTNTPVLLIGPDTTLCDGAEVLLTVSVSGTTDVEWQDGTTGTNYLVNTEGLYWVTADNNGCIGGDTLVVNYSDYPSVEFEVNEVLCNGDETGIVEPVVATGGSNLQYEWSNGGTTGELSGLASGNYQVTITNEFDCAIESAVNITEPDPLAFLYAYEDVACYGDANGWLVIENAQGGVPPYEYSVNADTFANSTIFSGLSGGDYEIVVVDNNGCTESQLVSIYEPAGVFLDAGDDKIIQLGESVDIDAVLFPDFNQIYEWALGDSISCIACISPSANPIYTNNYVITAIDSITGCALRDTMRIIVEKPRNVYIPNAFSPNGDGINDDFFPFGDISVRKVNYFRVFDRWGELVHEANNFEISNPDYGWDGLLNGKYMNPAVYVFVAEIEFVDDVVKLYKGDVTLFR